MSKQEGKVFIGGLSWETTDEKLRRYFENFGTVQEAFVSYDRNTGRPRGFGFVVFADPIIADRVTQQQHTIDRREVEAKKALPKEESPVSKDAAAAASGQRTRKVFVGGLPPSVDEASLRAYFQEFGCVEDAVVMYDHENRRPRGFGFITYTEEDAVERVFVAGAIHTLHDKPCEVKRAVPRDSMPPSPRAGYRGGAPPPHAHYSAPPPPHLLYHPTPDRPPYADAPRHYGGGGRYGGHRPPYGGFSGRGGMRGMVPGAVYSPPGVVTGIPAAAMHTPGDPGLAGGGLSPGALATPPGLGPASPLAMTPGAQLVGGGSSGGYAHHGRLPNGGLSSPLFGGLDAQQAAAAGAFADLHSQHAAAAAAQQQQQAAAAALTAAMGGHSLGAPAGGQGGQQGQSQATIWS